MKDNENIEDTDYFLAKDKILNKNEFEFDCHGISFSDTCSSVSRL